MAFAAGWADTALSVIPYLTAQVFTNSSLGIVLGLLGIAFSVKFIDMNLVGESKTNYSGLGFLESKIDSVSAKTANSFYTPDEVALANGAALALDF